MVHWEEALPLIEIPLQIGSPPYEIGAEFFSTIVHESIINILIPQHPFLSTLTVINLISFTVIAISYLLMYTTARRTQMDARRSANEDGFTGGAKWGSVSARRGRGGEEGS